MGSMHRSCGVCMSESMHLTPEQQIALLTASSQSEHTRSAIHELVIDLLNLTDFERDEQGRALLPKYGTRLTEVRSKLSGYHFAKESISPQAAHILFYAEALMSELDRRHGGYAQ